VALNAISLDPESVRDTLGVLLKYQEDVDRMLGGESAHLLDELRAASILR
jgi:hypothetical protein